MMRRAVGAGFDDGRRGDGQAGTDEQVIGRGELDLFSAVGEEDEGGFHLKMQDG